MLHHYITAHEQNKTESGIFVSLISFLLPEDVHSELFYSCILVWLNCQSNTNKNTNY